MISIITLGDPFSDKNVKISRLAFDWMVKNGENKTYAVDLEALDGLIILTKNNSRSLYLIQLSQ